MITIGGCDGKENTAPVELRCTVCGQAGVLRPEHRGDVTPFSDLLAWITAHRCPRRLAVN